MCPHEFAPPPHPLSFLPHTASRSCAVMPDLSLRGPLYNSTEAHRNGESVRSPFPPSSNQEGGLSGGGSVDTSRLAFVYGTLKRGFGNYWLIEELIHKGHARYLGTACTKERYPLVCGPFQVPFLLDFPASGHNVRGELYQVDGLALVRLDELEGVTKGHYVRRSVTVTGLQLHNGQKWDVDLDSPCLEFLAVNAEAYFAAPNYSLCMARAPPIPCFTEEEASTYIRRKDRPQNRTFLEHISAWIEERGFAEPSQATKEGGLAGLSRVS